MQNFSRSSLAWSLLVSTALTLLSDALQVAAAETALQALPLHDACATPGMAPVRAAVAMIKNPVRVMAMFLRKKGRRAESAGISKFNTTGAIKQCAPHPAIGGWRCDVRRFPARSRQPAEPLG